MTWQLCVHSNPPPAVGLDVFRETDARTATLCPKHASFVYDPLQLDSVPRRIISTSRVAFDVVRQPPASWDLIRSVERGY